MKFEKFFKSIGVHGYVYVRANGDKWLIGNGVGMIVPAGFKPFLGGTTVPGKTGEVVEAIVRADCDEILKLTKAELPADGKAADIKRVFTTPGLDEVKIYNCDFGLLEKADVNLAYLEIEDDDLNTLTYMVVFDGSQESVIGFIRGIDEQ
jgi:hypothetical protein